MEHSTGSTVPVEIVDENPDVLGILEARVGTSLRAASWLSDRLLLLVFHTRRYRDWDPEITVRLEGGDRPLLTRGCRFPADEDGAVEGRALLVIVPDGVVGMRAPRIEVEVRSWRRSITVDPGQLADRLVDARSILRSELADLPDAPRAEILGLLASSSEWHSANGGGLSLSLALNQVRNGLREPYPLAVTGRDHPQGLAVDLLLSLDDRSFWIQGWHRDADGAAERLLAVAPEGLTFDVLPGAYAYDRPDVRALYDIRHSSKDERSGFIHYFRLSAPSRLSEGWLCELHSRVGSVIEAPVPAVLRDPVEARNRILSELARADQFETLARNHVHPALSRMREGEVADVGVEVTRVFGRPPKEPEISLVLPLYRRLDMLEHQFAQFVHDPGMAEAEIVLVLDALEQHESVERRARDLHELYGIPFRLVVLNRNSGVSLAFNLGAHTARGRLLVLMHSDVLPVRPGWLEAMASQLARVPEAGAVGPRLLYEDGTIQSAGLFFREGDDARGWEAAHLLRGMHGEFPVARQSRAVAAVSSACMMIARDRFQEIGGFRADFVQGGYEDADLCLRLAERGYESWYTAGAELFHLEGHSYPDGLKAMANHYNRWLHNRTWGARMEGVRSRHPVRGMTPQPRPRTEPAPETEEGR